MQKAIKKKDYVIIAILADLLEGKLTDWAMVLKYKQLNCRNVQELRKYVAECEDMQKLKQEIEAGEVTLLTLIT